MKPCNLFADKMIFQRNKPISIFGAAQPGEEVAAELAGADGAYAAFAAADENGDFSVTLPALAASFSPYTLKVTGARDSYEFRDILIGEVWCAAGQSNMQFTAGASDGWESWKTEPGCAAVRILTMWDVPDENGFIDRAYLPQKNLAGHFKWTTAEKIGDSEIASAIGLEFALRLCRALDMPVGIVGNGVGGSDIDSWLPREAIEGDGRLLAYAKRRGRYVDASNHNSFGTLNYTQMSGIYNERIAPIGRYRLAGVLWYQGETNLGAFDDALHYEAMLKALIASFRRDFRDERLPIICSHIASHHYGADDTAVACVNEAIDYACGAAGGAYPVPILDIPLDYIAEKPGYYWHPIHPTLKRPVAARMAGVALDAVYGKASPYGFARCKSCEAAGGALRLAFDGAYGGLRSSNGGGVIGFTACGEDGIYYEADAKITGENTVDVRSEYVNEPLAACYGFYNFNDNCTLENGLGLPVLPFRTRREDPAEKRYYQIQRYMGCDHETVFENMFSPVCGLSAYRPAWSAGTVCECRGAEIFFDKEVKSRGASSLRVEYGPCVQAGSLVGISPAIDYVNYRHGLDRYRYLSFDIKNPNGRDIVFCGILFKTAPDTVYRLGVKDAPADFAVAPSDGFRTLTVDLGTGLNRAGQPEDLSPERRKTAYRMQFTFFDAHKGALYLDNIRLHD
mgnify:CR=1 FL=1